MSRIYLDYNATTPLRPEALQAMTEVLAHHFGNPSSVHWAGAEAREDVDRARSQVAELMGVEPDAIVFMSSATEANNTVLRNAALQAPAGRPHRNLRDRAPLDSRVPR
jgi:cysteine desulfurase